MALTLGRGMPWNAYGGPDPFTTDYFTPFFSGWPWGRGEEEGREAGQGPQAGAGADQAVMQAPFTRTIPVDFIEREDVYMLRADMPGVHKAELRVYAERDVLRIGHEPNPERLKLDQQEQGTFHRAERVSTYRGRALRLPPNADMDAISAKFEDGVLEVRIPKRAPERGEAQGKRVEVA